MNRLKSVFVYLKKNKQLHNAVNRAMPHFFMYREFHIE